MLKLIYVNVLFFEVFRQKCKVLLCIVPHQEQGETLAPNPALLEQDFKFFLQTPCQQLLGPPKVKDGSPRLAHAYPHSQFHVKEEFAETRGKAQRDKAITLGEKLFLEKRLGEK